MHFAHDFARLGGSMCTALGMNPGLYSENPATNSLSCGIAICNEYLVFLTFTKF